MTAIVDTNVLVYRVDQRFPEKQQRAEELLRDGIAEQSLLLPYQVLVEFVSAVIRPVAGGQPLLSRELAYERAERLLVQFPILYPTEHTYRTALRGHAIYGLSWYDACLWAYADEGNISTIWSEDFQHGRLYGKVRAMNPFAHTVHENDAPAYKPTRALRR